MWPLRSKALSFPAKYHARNPRPAKDPAVGDKEQKQIHQFTFWKGENLAYYGKHPAGNPLTAIYRLRKRKQPACKGDACLRMIYWNQMLLTCIIHIAQEYITSNQCQENPLISWKLCTVWQELLKGYIAQEYITSNRCRENSWISWELCTAWQEL